MTATELLDELQKNVEDSDFPWENNVFLYYKWAVPTLKKMILEKVKANR